jgi:hypothetical protein
VIPKKDSEYAVVAANLNRQPARQPSPYDIFESRAEVIAFLHKRHVDAAVYWLLKDFAKPDAEYHECMRVAENAQSEAQAEYYRKAANRGLERERESLESIAAELEALHLRLLLHSPVCSGGQETEFSGTRTGGRARSAGGSPSYSQGMDLPPAIHQAIQTPGESVR